jgi:hypothetical protein
MIIASFEGLGGFDEHKGDLLALEKKIDVHDVTPKGSESARSLSHKLLRSFQVMTSV